MKKIVRLTESDLVRLVKRVINEENNMLYESAQAISDAKKRFDSGEKPNPKIVKQVKECITKNQLTSLMFLTTSAGSYALGIVCLLIGSGVGSLVGGGILALSGIILTFITSLPKEYGGLGADPNKDITALLSCMNL